MSVHARTLPESSYFLIIPTLHSNSKLRKREAMGMKRKKGREKYLWLFISSSFDDSALRMLVLLDVEFLLPFLLSTLWYSFSFGGSFWHKHTNTGFVWCYSYLLLSRFLCSFLFSLKLENVVINKNNYVDIKLGFKCLCMLLYLMKAQNNFWKKGERWSLSCEHTYEWKQSKLKSNVWRIFVTFTVCYVARSCVFTVGHNYILFEEKQQLYTRTCYYTFILCVNNTSQWIYSRHFHLYDSCLLLFLQPLTASPFAPKTSGIFIHSKALSVDPKIHSSSLFFFTSSCLSSIQQTQNKCCSMYN